MRERKATKARLISEKESVERKRMIAENELIETLRLCNGVIGEKQLKDICYWLKIDAAVQSGWLTEHKNPDGSRSFVRGPNLRPRELRTK
jgi:hypothetical protein